MSTLYQGASEPGDFAIYRLAWVCIIGFTVVSLTLIYVGQELRQLRLITQFLQSGSSSEYIAVPSETDDEAQIRTLLDEFLANSATRSAHERMWADDLVYTSSDGSRTNKAEILAGFETEQELAVVDFHGEDVVVSLFGAMAVVTFRLVGTPRDGTPARHYFNTGTFAKRNGKWVAVAWQATRIPGSQDS